MPRLVIGSAVAPSGSNITIPVTLQTNGAAINSWQFALSWGPCLTYRPSPGVTYTLPAGWSTNASYDPAVVANEVKILAYTLGSNYLMDGAMLAVPFTVNCYPPLGQTTVVEVVTFAADPISRITSFQAPIRSCQ